MKPRSHNPSAGRPAGHPGAGFTLLEALVYLLVIGVVLTAATSLTFAFLSADARARASSETERNARFAVDRLAAETRESAGINVADSVFGADPGRLSLATDDPATNPTVFTVSGGQLFVQQGLGPAQPLTAPSVQVAEFTIDDLSPSAFARVVRFHLRARYASNNDIFSAQYVLETTAAVRQAEGFSN